MKVSVVILNWNGCDMLRTFLPSVVRYSEGEGIEVCVADNGSTDASVTLLQQEFPSVRTIVLDQNYGFADGYNLALQQVDAEYVVLLNSDVEVTEHWLKPMIAYLDKHPEVAACQPKIRSQRQKEYFEYAGAAGGFIDKYGYPFCRGRIMGVVEKDEGQYDTVIPVFWATGAALFIRRADYVNVGGLDGRFFAHMEEIDLCWRLKNGGYTLKVVPSSVVYHLGGGSLPMNHPRKLFLNYRNNLLMLHKNLCAKQRKKIFFARVLLDTMAGGLFLLKGQWSNTRSVIRAYKAFREMRKAYPVPESSISLSGIYPRSIVLEYFLRGKKKFSDLNFK